MQVFRDFLPHFQMLWLTPAVLWHLKPTGHWSLVPCPREGPQGKSIYTRILLSTFLFPVAGFPLDFYCFWLIFSAFRQYLFYFVWS